MDGKSLLTKQSARILLVDFSGPCDRTTIKNIQQTLEQFFCLICSMYGSPRVPFFGLFALGNCPEVLFPLQHVKGNFSRLQSAFKELVTFHEESECSRQHSTNLGDTSSMVQGIVEATNMFKRQAQSLLQVAGCCVQLEILVLTSKNSLSVTKQAEKALQQLSVESIKKVQVVSVQDPDRLCTLDESSPSGSTSDLSSHSSQSSGMVDQFCLDNDVLSLDSYFRSWLHDSATDREHLHLIIPASGQDDNSSVLIKCDLHERLLNPELTQFSNCFTIHSESKPMTYNTSTKSQNASPPLHKLRVTKRLPAEGLCESVLFGLPSIVKATSCWKVDWDELEKNERNFQALCHLLHSQKEILLATLEDEPITKATNQRGFRYQVSVPRPSGHFVLLPSHGNALLLKSVAVKEFLLPCDFVPSTETSIDSALDGMKQSLSKLESCELYNPLLEESGLYKSLTQRLSKNVPGTSNVGKRKASSTAPSKPQSYHTKPPSVGLAGAAPLTFTSASSVYQTSRWAETPGPAGDGRKKGQNKFL